MLANIKYIKWATVLAVVLLFIQCKGDNQQTEPQKVENQQGKKKPRKRKKSYSSDTIKTISTQKKAAAKLAKKKVEEPKKIVKKEPVAKKKSVVKKKPVVKKKTVVKSKPKPMPKMAFEEMVWDFGEITEGDIIEHKFKFTNTGNGILQIAETSATCGCTRPSFPFIDIAPNETNVIGVRYNSVGKDGPQTPEITVVANTYPKVTILKLKGTVIPKKEEKTKETEVDTSSTSKGNF